jgi:hypothetical protein
MSRISRIARSERVVSEMLRRAEEVENFHTARMVSVHMSRVPIVGTSSSRTSSPQYFSVGEQSDSDTPSSSSLPSSPSPTSSSSRGSTSTRSLDNVGPGGGLFYRMGETVRRWWTGFLSSG